MCESEEILENWRSTLGLADSGLPLSPSLDQPPPIQSHTYTHIIKHQSNLPLGPRDALLGPGGPAGGPGGEERGGVGPPAGAQGTSYIYVYMCIGVFVLYCVVLSLFFFKLLFFSKGSGGVTLLLGC